MRPVTVRKHIVTPYGVPVWQVCYEGQLVGMYKNGFAALAFVNSELKAAVPPPNRLAPAVAMLLASVKEARRKAIEQQGQP